MKYHRNYYNKSILTPVQRDEIIDPIMGKGKGVYRITGLIICLVGLFLLSACSDAAMETCQQTHSYETCAHTLR